ncbi:MAG: hypothetical protein HOP11_14125 [Saprospiraceae bacterium]|nr:hypothetical protein [Saprospiraceae bacterium]
MKKTTLIYFFLMIFSVQVVIVSCSGDDDDQGLTELIATDETFANFSSFQLHTTRFGADPSLGPAHGGNDATAQRKIYFKDNVAPVNGKYPIGAVIVKHSTNTAGTLNEITAMVKRGNNFDASGNDWEYFMLTPEGKIAKDQNGNLLRGGESLLGGACKSCHGKAAKDFIFTK